MPVWYAAYGSNLSRDRFLTYLKGGRPPGASRSYRGARDTRPPTAERAFTMPGQVFFGWESPTWGGGIAFYDADTSGAVLARVYRVTEQQFADVAAQEMHREPGEHLDLGHVLQHARQELGPGRYETLHLVGELDGEPVLTFTATKRLAVQRNPPSPAYLRTVAHGLRETHGVGVDDVVAYLLRCPGVGPHWSAQAVRELLTTSAPRPG